VMFQFQSTPPCGRRQREKIGEYSTSAVSIHASVREATYTEAMRFPDYDVSIHASVREATRAPCMRS